MAAKKKAQTKGKKKTAVKRVSVRALQKRRSEAAKKGWETRRHNQAAKKPTKTRSDAAKKGWETRKKKGATPKVTLRLSKAKGVEGFTNPQDAVDYFNATWRHDMSYKADAFYERQAKKFGENVQRAVDTALETKRKELAKATSIELFDEMMRKFPQEEREKFLRASDRKLRKALLDFEKHLQLKALGIMLNHRERAERIIKGVKEVDPFDTEFELAFRLDRMTRVVAEFGPAEIDIVPGLIAAAIGASDNATRDALAHEIQRETGWQMREIYRLIHSPGAEDFELAN